MTFELENNEKIDIVKQHLRNVANNKFNLELSIAQANAMATPNSAMIDSYNLQLSDLHSQELILSQKLSELEAQI
jgi:hypothetical protein